VIKIDKKIPIPTSSCRSAGGKTLYPTGKLEIGDSFLYGKDLKRASRYASMYNMIHKPKKIIARDDNGLARIWRVE